MDLTTVCRFYCDAKLLATELFSFGLTARDHKVPSYNYGIATNSSSHTPLSLEAQASPSCLANCVCFPRLPLQRVLLFLIVAMGVLASAFASVRGILLRVCDMVLHTGFVHLLQRVHCLLDIRHERIATAAREVFTDDNCKDTLARDYLTQ